MILPLQLLMDAPVSTWFGAAGLAGQLVWPLFGMRTAVLSAQLGTASCYATQHALMGQSSGACVCLAGATQSAITLIAGEKSWLNRLQSGFIPLVVLLGYLTWSGLPSVLSAAPLGIGYDLAVGAVPALLGAILPFAIGAAAFRRGWISRDRKLRTASAEAAAATD